MIEVPRQFHVPTDQVRSSGQELKHQIFEITGSIILGARTALLGKERYNADLIAWGGVIDSFDSFIGIYYQNDDEYYKLRKEIKKLIYKINPYDQALPNKLKIKRIYDSWFRLICVKLAKFKIFPALSVSYTQAIGEITEELELIMIEEGEKDE